MVPLGPPAPPARPEGVGVYLGDAGLCFEECYGPVLLMGELVDLI